MSFHVPEAARITDGLSGTPHGFGNAGAFEIGSVEPGWTLFLICSDGGGWEHVSISARRDRGDGTQTRTPTWREMAHVKEICWDAEDVAMQLHPARSTYVNQHPHCLHLWRPTPETAQAIPTPPTWMVGVVEPAAPAAPEPLPPMPSVYVAAPYEVRQLAFDVAMSLQRAGCVITSSWLHAAMDFTLESAVRDLRDVRDAEAVVVINPIQFHTRGTGGRHVELGYAIARRKFLILLGEPSNIFHLLPTVTVAPLLTDAIRLLGQFRGRR